MRKFARLLLLELALIAATILSARGQSFLTNGLIDYYPFNGNANDAVGANNGTVVGATLASDRYGNANHAYSFNGTTYIQFADTGIPASGNPRTVSLWIKMDSFGGVTYPFSYGTDGATDAFYAIVSDLGGSQFIAVGKSGGGDTPRWQGAITNVWYHLAITYSNPTASIYVNSTNFSQATRSYVTTSAGHFYVGRYVASAVPPTFYGLIDDVRIYNRAFSSNEVSQLYHYEAPLPQIASVSKALRVDCTNLVAGGLYQLQASPDLVTWTNYGLSFIANSTNLSQYVDVGWGNGYFRVSRP
jgi:hypothetical protein